MMIRSGRFSQLARSVSLSISTTRTTTSITSRHVLKSQLSHRVAPTLALTKYKALSTSVKRFDGPYDKIDKKHEDKVEREKLVPHPGQVSQTSSVHEVFHEKGVEDPEEDVDMLAGIKSDWVSDVAA